MPARYAFWGLLVAVWAVHHPDPAVANDPRVIRQGEASGVVRDAPDYRRPRVDQRLPGGREARGTRNILAAWFADPTTRYRRSSFPTDAHAGALVVSTADRRVLKLTLPEGSVFEDREPRLWDVDGDALDEIVVVRSYFNTGAALAVVAVQGDTIRIALETPPAGAPFRWLNPAGIGDFDGDGRPDIALVRNPHTNGELEIWTLQGSRLVKTFDADDVANHVVGSAHQRLAAVADFNGDGVVDLAVPTFDRRALRILSFKGGRMREIARPILPGPATEDFAVVSEGGRVAIRVGIGAGRVVTVLP